jgi:putative protease
LAEEGKLVGEITHYFGNIGVAVIKLKGTLKEGDEIQIKGATTDFKQKAKSMQVEHKKIEQAKKGDSVGLKVKDKVRNGDSVYKL